MKVTITAVAIGSWYSRGLFRMAREFQRTENVVDMQVYIEEYPPGTPDIYHENGVNYRPYAAKPFAMQAAFDAGADMVIQLDAAFWPIRSIAMLTEHIAKVGYYLCDNGALLGDWVSDRFVDATGESRHQLRGLRVREVSSYAVGLMAPQHNRNAANLLRAWGKLCSDPSVICGPHSVMVPGDPKQNEGKRNPGFVSTDPTVRGHRHDQSALSIAAHWWGCDILTPRPIFTAYDGSQDERTVLVNRGM